jgi:hypothetical protein
MLNSADDVEMDTNAVVTGEVETLLFTRILSPTCKFIA